MKTFLLIRGALLVLLVAIGAWVVNETRWVEITVDEDPRGAAATDHQYTLRRIVEANGATLEMRTSLEPLPPPGATLLLDSNFWNIFPGRAERLETWVRDGGHLVVQGMHAYADKDLHWLPISFVASRPPPASARGGVPGTPPPRGASAPGDVVGTTLPRARDDNDDAVPAADTRQDDREQPFDNPFKDPFHTRAFGVCRNLAENAGTTEPAYEPGRVYRACSILDPIHPLNQVEPIWQLADRHHDVLALRVPYGRGSVTGVSYGMVLDNRGLLRADNGLILGAVLQARPGRAIWVVEDESREALPLWMWHEARTPTLLILAAMLLSLWRLLPRFGPREAAPPPGRRSMGEQVSGTGQFIANADPRALHDATRKAFEAVGRTRIDGWADRDDADRVAALAGTLAPALVLDQPALLAALHPAGAATPSQILAAIAVIEQARRALLRAAVSPFAN